MSPMDVNNKIKEQSKLRITLKANNVQTKHHLANVNQLQVKTIQGVSVIFLQQMANLLEVRASLTLFS